MSTNSDWLTLLAFSLLAWSWNEFFLQPNFILTKKIVSQNNIFFFLYKFSLHFINYIGGNFQCYGAVELGELNLFMCKCNADKEVVVSRCCEGCGDSEGFGHKWSSDICD